MDRLMALLSLPGPSGDEGAVTDWLLHEIPVLAPGAACLRLGDNLLAVRGTPRVAVFAHIDTTGWTLGYNGVLLPIGGPEGQLGDPLRCTAPAADGTVLRGRLEVTGEEDTATLHLGRDEAVGPQETPGAADAPPGTRWVYDREPVLRENRLTAAYLDNRAGVWCALRALARSPHIAVAFTTGEEQHGHGARVCARWLYDSFRLTQALIADTTWATEYVRCGEGPVVSLRDIHCPRQSYLHRVVSLAETSGLPYQREIQSSGSSDGSHLLRSSVPIDWAFVGVAAEGAHTSEEQVDVADLDRLGDLLAHLADRL